MKKHKQAKPKTKSEAIKALGEQEPDSAGIDLGANEIWVAVPADRDQKPVRQFGAFTQDLMAIVQWLIQCGVRSVAMESTGVYWIPLFQLLDEAGLKVLLSQCAARQKRAGAKEGRARLPVVAVSAQCGLTVRLASSGTGHLCCAFYLPLPSKPALHGLSACAAHAGSPGSDEYQAASRH